MSLSKKIYEVYFGILLATPIYRVWKSQAENFISVVPLNTNHNVEICYFDKKE